MPKGLRDSLNQVEAQKKGTPEEFIGRKYINSSDLEGKTFTNDENPIIVVKPKMTKKSEDEPAVRATNKFDEPIFQDVVWLPVEVSGEKCVVCTIQPDVAKIVRTLGEPEAILMKGNDFEDENRVVKLKFKDRFDGTLKFNKVKVKYADGKQYDNFVLDEA